MVFYQHRPMNVPSKTIFYLPIEKYDLLGKYVSEVKLMRGDLVSQVWLEFQRGVM